MRGVIENLKARPIEAARRYKLGVLAVATAALLVLGACQFTKVSVDQDADQGQGQTVGGPTAEASPASPQCALTSIAPGTVEDSRTIRQGGELGGGVSLLGPQGLELADTCRSQYTVTWLTVSGPCTISADISGTATFYAPLTAAVDSICKFRANVSTYSVPLHDLRVVAGTSSFRPRALDGDPEPEPSPTPDPELGVVDR